MVDGSVSREMFLKDYASVFDGDHRWKGLDVPEGELFAWNDKSTYVRKQTFFDGMKATAGPGRRSSTRPCAGPPGRLGHHRPHLPGRRVQGLQPGRQVSDRARRGAEELQLLRFSPRQPRDHGARHVRQHPSAQPAARLRGRGGDAWRLTYDFLDKKPTTIFEASRDYIDNKVPLVVLAGKEYGTGSSRDWAAKGTVMLGVKAVITESFERIHRSNLIGMGVLPLQFPAGESYESLGLNGTETYDIAGVEKLNEGVTPKTVHVTATHEDGSKTEFDAVVRIDTPGEADYYRNGGILQYVLRNLMK